MSTNSNDAVELYELLHGYQITQAIATAAKLRIADYLQHSPQSCTSLANTLQIDENKLYRLMRALASINLFKEAHDKIFEITPKSRLLISTEQGTLHSFALRCGAESYLAWSRLYEGISSDTVPFVDYFQESFFPYLKTHEQASQQFNLAMVAHTNKDIASILKSYDFSSAKRVVDIGCGYGQLAQGIMEQYPHLQGILFDQPAMIQEAKKSIAERERYHFIEGDFLQSIPAEGDLYLMKHILHDWNDEQALAILRHCHHACQPENKLLIIETLVPTGNTPHASKWQDLHMLALFGGKERTENELTALVNQAGFTLSRIIPLQRSGLSQLSIVECAR